MFPIPRARHPLRILAICPLHPLVNTIDVDIVEELGSRPDVWLEVWGHGHPHFEPDRPVSDVIAQSLPDGEADLMIEMAGGCQDHPGMADVNCCKAYVMADYWGGHCGSAEYCNRIGFDVVFSQYLPPVLEYQRHHRAPIRWLPHCVNTRRFQDRRQPRIHEVASLGAHGAEDTFYPTRASASRILAEQTEFCYFTRPHPGYYAPFNPEGLRGEAYAESLAQTRVFVATGGRYQLAFAKHLEAMASGACVLAPPLFSGGGLFRPYRDFWVFALDASDLMEQCRALLQDDGLRERVAASGMECARSRHSVEVRVQELIECLYGGHGYERYAWGWPT